MTTFHAGDRSDHTLGDVASADHLDRVILSAIAREGPFDDGGPAGPRIANVATADVGTNVQTDRVLRSLARLNRDGLVVVRTRGDVIVHVEATAKGYRQAGVPEQPVGREVGRQSGGAPLRATDGTDFRTHGPRAVGGEIIRRRQPPEVVRARLNGDGSWSRAAQSRIKEDDLWPVVAAIGASRSGPDLAELNRRLGLKESSFTRLRARRAEELGLVRIEPRRPGHVAMTFHLTAEGRAGLAARAEATAPAIQAAPSPTVHEITPARRSRYPGLAAWRRDVASLDAYVDDFQARGMADVADLIRSKIVFAGDRDELLRELVDLIDDLGGLED